MTTYPVTARAAYEQLSDLGARLADPATRVQARAELRALADLAAAHTESDAPLRLAVVDVALGARQERLELLLLPSIFAPEEWAFTFLEGLLEVPLDEYDGKRLVEVGSGSGWICIALARFTGLARLVGLDLNPQAAAVATCNAWLNGDEALAARLRFHTSDLLDALPADERWDFVVGCIPQVLRAETATPADDGEQALYELSNYTAVQNVYEDSFGLGLIARLLDEVPERFAPAGRCVLNLAGRPGRAIIERMFSRRGFGAEVLFARRVMQAADTDIRPLVELERRTRRAFEFFIEAHSPEPICADTALGLLEAGQPIWHEVAVWHARLRLPRETLALRRALRALGSAGLLAELDLSAASQEQLASVAALARRLAHAPILPYAHEAGDLAFRTGVARYLRRFFDLALDPAEIFVAPEREQAVYSLLLASCDPGDRALVSRNVHDVCAPALAKAGVRATVTNNTLREVRRLLDVVAGDDVRVVLLAVEPEERSNLSALRDILDTCGRRGILVVIDESAYFRITRAVEPRTLFEFLAREPHRPHLVVLYGLIKNAVFPDLELSLLLPVPARLHADLAVAAEVTYSRIGTLPQWLYEWLFAELLSFRIAFGPSEPPPPRPAPAVPLPRSRLMASLAGAPAFAPHVFRDDDPDLVRLDYGENEAPPPPALLEGLIAACAAPASVDGPHDGPHGLAAAVAAFLLETRGVRYGAHEIVLAQGVWPLLHDLGVALAARLGRPPRVFVATPCYAVLPPTLAASGCEVEALPLARLYDRSGRAGVGDTPDVVVISQPANPAGVYLDHEELVALASYVVDSRALLVSDEIFGLLDLDSPATETVPSPVTLEQAVPGIGSRTLLLGGLSKEMAAGGLRVGWMALRDADLAERLRAVALGHMHLIAARTAAHVYGAWRRNAAGRLVHPERHRALREHLAALRRELASKRRLVAGVFPAGPEHEARNTGGLFFTPNVSAWLGRVAGNEVLTPENLTRVLYEATHVVVNSGAWCGDPERVRVMFSVPWQRLERAVERLRAFAAALRAPG